MEDEEKSRLCRSCGNCCKTIIFEVRKPDLPDEQKIFVEWVTRGRGCKILREFDKFWRVRVHHPCPHLEKYESNDEPKLVEYRCDIYQDRPENCRRFDGRLAPKWDNLKCAWTGEGQHGIDNKQGLATPSVLTRQESG